MVEQQHLENRAIAERLDSFATLLELAGASPVCSPGISPRSRADPGTEAPVADLIRAGRVRELRGIGRGIEGRLKELIETGEIAELEELEREVSPDLVGLGRFLGIGANRAVQIAKALGVRTAAELRAAAAARPAPRSAGNRAADRGEAPGGPAAGRRAPAAARPAPPSRPPPERRDRRAARRHGRR